MKFSDDQNKYLTKNPVKKILVQYFLKEIAFLVKSIKPKTILDVGCGEGFVDAYLLQENPKLKIKGVDLSAAALREAKKQARRLSFQRANAYFLPFPPGSFDLTICMEVLEHLDNPRKAIIEARRVSKKYCLFSVPNEPYFSLLAGRHSGHVNHWSKRSFGNLTQKYFRKPIIMKTSSVWIIAIGEK